MHAVLVFLLETLAFLLVGSALLRAWMNQLRINMSGQPGRFVMAMTHWLVGPLRKLLPRSVVQSRIDWGSLVAALLLALAYGVLWVLLQTVLNPVLMAPALLMAVPVLAFKLLLRVMLQGLMVLLLGYAVLSWVQPMSPVMALLERLCAPILQPIRRIVPPIGGVDLSVLVLIVLLQIGLILLA
ncbi:YggT family protein [Hydrogenophaga sp.]|uniref:YggT family protein n=1 Tax=Hydrogenophaga sp. TaxID=1904254 RepID=UPI0035B0E6A5